MKIDGWQIEGFGVFQDWEVRGLSGGLTVFLGPNEAGKSTLLAFLRGALFGFPSGRSRAPRYPPARGGRHGGRLMLRGPQGEFVVERIVARKNGLRVNGRESAGEELQDLLGGADETVFCSVFAFSLSEMQSFEWLKAEQIRERIFSAGIAGAGASARQVIDTLETEAAAMFRPRGSSRVRELLDQIERAERDWKRAQEEAGRYSSLEREQEEWTARAAALSAEEQDLRRKLHAVEALLNLWADHTRARERLAALDTGGEFPADAEARFTALTGEVEAAKAALRRLEEQESAGEQFRAQLAAGLDPRLVAIADRVEEFHGKLALHQERLKALEAARLEQTGRTDYRWAIGAGLGVFIAFPGGWLMARGETAGGLAVLFAGLFVAGLLIYWRVTRNERNRATVARLEAEVAGWEQPVREWSGSSSCAEPLISEFLDLRDRCRKDRDIRTKLATLDEATAVTRAQVESARAELALGETALRGFLQESGAADAAGFRSRLRMFQERADLSALIRDRENRIGALGETLSSGRYEELRRESAHTLELLANVRARRDEAIGEQRLAEAARRQIAESTAIPTIKAELEWLRSELALSIRAWRVARLARELVGRTLQEFTRSRQPAVLEMASEAFARVTAGAYKRILQADTVCRQEDARNRPYRQADTVFHQPDARDRPYRQADTVFHQPDARNKPYRQADTVFHQPDARDKPYRQSEDGESLVAIDRDGQRKRPEELSRGTAEQLYLCLRLALAAEFARRTAALPLVMDDVLVNFDPERAAAVARELAHFSRQHQVLIFTCHPETARLFAEAAPGTGVIRMGRDTRLSAAK